MKVCVIGAGVSGLACCVTLKQHKIDFECFEKSNDIGGIWNYKADDSESSVYRNCTLNHANHVMVYPFGKRSIQGHHFAHRNQYFNYLKETTEDFNLADHIHFNSEINYVKKADNGLWLVKTNSHPEREFTHIIVCAGYYSKGVIPKEYLANYTGSYLHSSNYRSPNAFKNNKVLVVGSGSSAIQIACDLANVTDNVHISVREMPYVVPKFIMGKPYSSIYFNSVKKLPRNIQSRYLESMIAFFNGKQEDYGIPAPNQRLLDGRLPISQDIFDKTACGMIQFRPAIQNMHNNKTTFTDGTHETFDKVIFSTGFQVQLPFLRNIEFDVNKNYKFISNMDHDNLFFCGYLQPVGPVPPVVTTQANFIARVIKGTLKLPNKIQQQSYMNELFTKLQSQFSQEFTGRIHISDYLNILKEDLA